MRDYISVYDNVLNEEYCRDLINRFEENVQCHEKKLNQGDEWQMSFTQINLFKHDIFKKDVDFLTKIFQFAIEEYIKDNDIQAFQWPTKYRMEQIRMKRYLPGGTDRFDLHVDVTDRDSARRFLVVFFYLNNDFVGGETDFPQLQTMAKPKPGRLIMFPPMWAWWHKANPIVNGSPKYIVGTLLHYV